MLSERSYLCLYNNVSLLKRNVYKWLFHDIVRLVVPKWIYQYNWCTCSYNINLFQYSYLMYSTYIHAIYFDQRHIYNYILFVNDVISELCILRSLQTHFMKFLIFVFFCRLPWRESQVYLMFFFEVYLSETSN